MKTKLPISLSITIMMITAEFVAEAQILQVIEELGVDYAQGYYLGEPKEDIIDAK